MTEAAKKVDDRLTLGEVLRQRGIPARDCRDCSKFDADPEGRGFGWCQAHDQFVKLYHPDGEWHSQCQFKTIRLVREVRPEPARPEGN
jgi:hypothetical protein